MHLALEQGRWPVLDEPWVYPAGALVPMLLPALGSTVSTVGYALGWCALVTSLNAVAMTMLIRPGAPATGATATTGITGATGTPDATGHVQRAGPARTAGAWWWLAFLALLGPIALGRLDAVVAPLMMIALALAVRSTRWTAWAAALLTFGAWVKVAPGALLLPLVAAARRPLRQVVLPAAAVCGVVLAAVAAGGGLTRVAGFLTTQQGRGLQVESVTATPWVLLASVRDDVAIGLNEALITYEVTGPGTTTAVALLDVALVAAVVAVGALLLVARRRGTAAEALLPGALTLLTTLIVLNKVGSPQFITWLAAPVAVLLTVRARGGLIEGGWADDPAPGSVTLPAPTTPRWWLTVAAVLALVIAGLTQAVFPWGYLDLLSGSTTLAVVLALRNLGLVALLMCAVVGLVDAVRGTVGVVTGRRAWWPGRSHRAGPDGPRG